MKEHESGYRHRTERTGVSDEKNHELEHRDTASGEEKDRNELEPGGRREPDGYGPRTSRDTKIDGSQ